MDDPDTCQDLNLRMQSVLVKQHVLDALGIIEDQKREEEDMVHYSKVKHN